jgi:hypothetical protein
MATFFERLGRKVLIPTNKRGILGLFSSLVSNQTVTIQVGYYDISFDALKYASCNSSCTDNANWTTMRVDNLGAGQFASLAVDSKARPALSYSAER